MGASFGGSERMDFIEDDRFDGTQGVTRVRSEQEVERFRRGDQNVSWMAKEASAFGSRRVTRSNGDGGLMGFDSQALRRVGDADERGLKIAVDIDGKRFDR